MPISLRPIHASRFEQWMRRSRNEYAKDLMLSGNTGKDAQKQAEAALRGAFPEGVPSGDNAVFDLIDEEETVVGYVWIGRDHSDDPTAWWVWDILVEPQHRGTGYGRAGMQLAEQYARSQGANTLGLSVFGFNGSARGLYESLGYEATSIKMRKQLDSE